jgi:glutamate dehydrogenase (NAD(P)+)
MGEEEIGWFVKANGSRKSATGKPKILGGLPHELGSTGYGVFHAALVGMKYAGIKVTQATIAVEGFGNVGWFAAKYLTEAGAKLVAVSDSKGTIYNKQGLDFKTLALVKKELGTVTRYAKGASFPGSEILRIKADILITAAIPDLVKDTDVSALKFRLIVEGSNIPMSHATEGFIHRKKILVIPDIIANSGGVISSYIEHIGGTEGQMRTMVQEKITRNVRRILDNAKRLRITPRESALQIARQRVKQSSGDSDS